MLGNVLGLWRLRFIYGLNRQFLSKNLISLSAKLIGDYVKLWVQTVWCVNIFVRYKYDRHVNLR